MVGSIAAVIALVIAGLGLSAWSIRRRGPRGGDPATEGDSRSGVGASVAAGDDGAGLLSHLLGHSQVTPAGSGGAGTAGAAQLDHAGGRGDTPEAGGADEGSPG
jgi:hypothetical protein